MKIGCWNVRGLNWPLKQNGVHNLMIKHKLDVLGILESKLSSPKLASIMKNKFSGFWEVDNFHLHAGGRILIIWNPAKVSLELIDMSPQVVHCKATCKVSSISFCISFVYTYNSVVGRRPLWLSLKEFSSQCNRPWLLLGDFNCVLKAEEKHSVVPVSDYAIKDFEESCIELGLSDIHYSGCQFTWSNNSVMSKLDRVMANSLWFVEGYFGHAHFIPAGSLSDHSASIVSILHSAPVKSKSFKFFNMWASHPSFFELVENEWQFEGFGSKQYVLCKIL